MAMILMNVVRGQIVPRIARHFDQFFEKILETQKIRQIDGRFRRNLTPKQIY